MFFNFNAYLCLIAGQETENCAMVLPMPRRITGFRAPRPVKHDFGTILASTSLCADERLSPSEIFI